VSLLFGALKFHDLGSPKILLLFFLGRNLALSLGYLDLRPRHVPRSDFALSILPIFCLAKNGEISKKFKNRKNITIEVKWNK